MIGETCVREGDKRRELLGDIAQIDIAKPFHVLAERGSDPSDAGPISGLLHETLLKGGEVVSSNAGQEDARQVYLLLHCPIDRHLTVVPIGKLQRTPVLFNL